MEDVGNSINLRDWAQKPGAEAGVCVCVCVYVRVCVYWVSVVRWQGKGKRLNFPTIKSRVSLSSPHKVRSSHPFCPNKFNVSLGPQGSKSFQTQRAPNGDS